MQSTTKLRAGLIGAALAFFLGLQILAQHPHLVENYYSNGLYPVVAFALSHISSFFSYSISEFLFWSLLLLGIPAIIYRVRKLKVSVGSMALNLLTICAVVYVWFYVFWGINYYRQPLQITLGLDGVQLPMNAFDSTLADLIQEGNALNVAYSVRPLEEINRTVEKSYSEVLHRLGLRDIPTADAIKPMLNNWVLNKTITSGWFSPFFHELHYNSDLLVFELPFVLAHEKAHQLGYTNEAEANFLAYLVCINAADVLCRYSGYFGIIQRFLRKAESAGNGEVRDRFVNLLNDGLKLDMRAVDERWRSHLGVLATLSRKGYHLYLKANRVQEGIANYDNVVDLVIRYHAGQGSTADSVSAR